MKSTWNHNKFIVYPFNPVGIPSLSSHNPTSSPTTPKRETGVVHLKLKKIKGHPWYIFISNLPIGNLHGDENVFFVVAVTCMLRVRGFAQYMWLVFVYFFFSISEMFCIFRALYVITLFTSAHSGVYRSIHMSQYKMSSFWVILYCPIQWKLHCNILIPAAIQTGQVQEIRKSWCIWISYHMQFQLRWRDSCLWLIRWMYVLLWLENLQTPQKN